MLVIFWCSAEIRRWRFRFAGFFFASVIRIKSAAHALKSRLTLPTIKITLVFCSAAGEAPVKMVFRYFINKTAWFVLHQLAKFIPGVSVSDPQSFLGSCNDHIK